MAPGGSPDGADKPLLSAKVVTSLNAGEYEYEEFAPTGNRRGSAFGGPISEELRKASWQDSTSILIGLIMGSGTLGLPYAMSQLGWVAGIGVCVVFGLFAVYSGLLLSKVRNNFCPNCENFSDIAMVVSGPRFGGFTKWAIWINWTLLLPYYLMSTTRALEVAIGTTNICFPEVMLCVVAGLALLVQLRTLHALTWLAAASGGAISISILLILIDFGLYAEAGTPGGAGFNKINETRLWPEANVGVVEVYGSTASFIFAYQGQSVFLEIMREMKNPQEFPKAVSAATGVMMFTYLLIITLSYLAKGEDIPDFAPDAVTDPIFRRVVGVLVAFNLFSSYLLTNVPLALAIHEAVAPGTAREFSGWKGRVHWFMITGILLGFSFIVANAIPFFGAFQGIIGAALGAPILFGWPPAFFLLSSRKFGSKVSWGDAILCRFLMYLVFPACFSLGLYSSIHSLTESWGSNGAPFDCHPA